MNSRELKAERIRQGKSVPYMCDLLGIKKSAYYTKESGKTLFNPDEIALIVGDFGFSPQQTSLIFFDGKLPVEQVELSAEKCG